MMKTKQNIIILAIIIVTVILAAWVIITTTPASKQDDHAAQQHAEGEPGHEDHDHEDNSIEMSDAQIRSAGMVIAQAQPAAIATTLTLPGEIRFNQDRTAHIVPRVDGIVESVAVDLGQQVKKGQVLAVLASSGVSELRSDAMAAQKRLALARTVFEREKELWEDKISAEQDYLQAQQALQEAEIMLQNTKQKLQALGAEGAATHGLNRYELRAPFDGMIVERHLSLGESVQASANVMTLADLSSVWAEIVVSARDLNTVRVGTQVKVKATSFDSQSNGVVSYVGSLLGEQTRTATARVTLPNPDGAWRPGLFVNVEMMTGEVTVPVAVTANAIQTVEDQAVVFIKTSEGFKATPVKTGRSNGEVVEIVEGLPSNTSYVAQGSFILKSELGKSSAEHTH